MATDAIRLDRGAVQVGENMTNGRHHSTRFGYIAVAECENGSNGPKSATQGQKIATDFFFNEPIYIFFI